MTIEPKDLSIADLIAIGKEYHKYIKRHPDATEMCLVYDMTNLELGKRIQCLIDTAKNNVKTTTDKEFPIT